MMVDYKYIIALLWKEDSAKVREQFVTTNYRLIINNFRIENWKKKSSEQEVNWACETVFQMQQKWCQGTARPGERYPGGPSGLPRAAGGTKPASALGIWHLPRNGNSPRSGQAFSPWVGFAQGILWLGKGAGHQHPTASLGLGWTSLNRGWNAILGSVGGAPKGLRRDYQASCYPSPRAPVKRKAIT